MKYVLYKNFIVPELSFSKKSGKNTIEICDEFIALDTETSHNHNHDDPVGWVYQWDFRIMDTHVYGRTVGQLVDTLDVIKQSLQLDRETRKIIIYIHNLSYDWHYLKDFIRKKYPECTENIIATSPHHLISYEIAGFEFRCSYKLSQQSLNGWQKSLHTRHVKMIDTIDYNTIRYPDTILKRRDWRYMFADTDVLYECIMKQLEIYNDTLLTVPLTITGYVRRVCRKHFKSDKCNRKQFLSMALSPELYDLCRREFAGGITHGNRYMVDDTITGTIRHRDFVSHYPSQQICYYAPVTKFILRWKYKKDLLNEERFYKWINKFCCIMKIAVVQAECYKHVTLPYAQSCKWRECMEKGSTIREDNGRILQFNGYTEIVVNEIDMKWLLKQYKIKYKVMTVYTAERGAYPQYLRDTVIQFFYGKTEKKSIVKELSQVGYDQDSPEMITAELDLLRNKGGLNGIYGMTATNPIRMINSENQYTGEWTKQTKYNDLQTDLENYYKSYNNFMSYQYGLWTTACARNELMSFVELIGYNNFIYADTDSIFYLSTPEIEKRIEKKNSELRKINDENHYYIEYNNKKIYFNQFEDENENISKFRFLHAKCYAYELDTGELKCTIAGVSKHGRKHKSRVKELGTIDDLTAGKIFYQCGGTCITYTFDTPHTEMIMGHSVDVASSGIISNTTKTLNDSITIHERMLLSFTPDTEYFLNNA